MLFKFVNYYHYLNRLYTNCILQENDMDKYDRLYIYKVYGCYFITHLLYLIKRYGAKHYLTTGVNLNRFNSFIYPAHL